MPKTRLRSQQITVDLPTPDSEPWINIVVQRVEMDDAYKTLNVVDRWGSVVVPVKNIALDVHTYKEIIPGLPDNLISVYGLADAITVTAVDLIIKKYGGVLNDKGFIMLEG